MRIFRGRVEESVPVGAGKRGPVPAGAGKPVPAGAGKRGPVPAGAGKLFATCKPE